MNNSLSLSHLAVVFSSNRALVSRNPFACFPYLMCKGTPDFSCHSPYAGVCGCFRDYSCRFLCFLRALHGMPRYRTMRAVWRGVKCLARWSYPARRRLSMRSSQRFIQAIRCFTAAWGELSGKYISASSFFAHAHA